MSVFQHLIRDDHGCWGEQEQNETGGRTDAGLGRDHRERRNASARDQQPRASIETETSDQEVVQRVEQCDQLAFGFRLDAVLLRQRGKL